MHTRSKSQHFLVGFNDYDPFAADPSKVLALRVDFMDRPVCPSDEAEVCLLDPISDAFVPIGRTTGWNFPQGGRQQWLRESGDVIFNVAADDAWRAIVVNPVSGASRIYEHPCYTVARDGGTFYGLNFARLHRLGGYGYSGLPDHSAKQNAPSDDGIWATEVSSGKSRLLVNIADVVGTTGVGSIPKTAVHYLTHILPSPSGLSLAFLHRYWLADGGIQTRLMTCARDGSALECRAEGFLSHFDWMDNEHIVIWGRLANALQQARSGGLLAHPALAPLLRSVKPVIRALLRRGTSLTGSYLVIGPKGNAPKKLGEGVLTEDGHPSLSPVDRQILLNDTYPDSDGWRRLFLYRKSDGSISELARHQQAQIQPDPSRLSEATQGIDPFVMKSFSKEHFAYSRSGIHCDFHPRWRSDGKRVCYDSNHEGTRRVYVLDPGSVQP